jgi:hypothetical protein
MTASSNPLPYQPYQVKPPPQPSGGGSAVVSGAVYGSGPRTDVPQQPGSSGAQPGSSGAQPGSSGAQPGVLPGASAAPAQVCTLCSLMQILAYLSRLKELQAFVVSMQWKQ